MHSFHEGWCEGLAHMFSAVAHEICIPLVVTAIVDVKEPAMTIWEMLEAMSLF